MNYENLIEQVKLHEGLRLKPYKCTANRLTIGYGRNLDDKGISVQEAEEMLLADLAEVEQSLIKHNFFNRLDEVRQAVLINMAFNLGVIGLLRFKNMITALITRDYETAANEMLDSKWAKQVNMRAIMLAEQMRTGEWQ
ncbi:glycoside hydrolase family protein [Glaciecola sp. KUL10]|uniref:glycoside hydrolase family protein n=1 Tax=Glaciecola sp. (strain KUL10) TaxID=2161813 RepID=UPI000D783A51|nr:glycoside hydrolase family protein [Glaciecola sp. KUL10]GBL02944.1 chain A, D20c mutant of T4 lysozyme [Glaciecola sp. KUL10]